MKWIINRDGCKIKIICHSCELRGGGGGGGGGDFVINVKEAYIIITDAKSVES